MPWCIARIYKKGENILIIDDEKTTDKNQIFLIRCQKRLQTIIRFKEV